MILPKKFVEQTRILWFIYEGKDSILLEPECDWCRRERRVYFLIPDDSEIFLILSGFMTPNRLRNLIFS